MVLGTLRALEEALTDDLQEAATEVANGSACRAGYAAGTQLGTGTWQSVLIGPPWSCRALMVPNRLTDRLSTQAAGP